MLTQVLPIAPGVSGFLKALPRLEGGQELDVPVLALRWTHRGLNCQMAFGEDHDHAKESIFKLFEQLFRGRVSPQEMTSEDPLNVFVHTGPDHVQGLYSRQNRRLAALLMLQACRRDQAVHARCLVRSVQQRHWGAQFSKAYDGGTGLSIQPHEGRGPAARAHHRGAPLFGGDGPRAQAAIRRAQKRPHSPETQEALTRLAWRAMLKPSAAAPDEETLTFASEPVQGGKGGGRSAVAGRGAGIPRGRRAVLKPSAAALPAK